MRYKALLSIDDLIVRRPESSRLTPIEFVESYVSKSGNKCRQVKCTCNCGGVKITTVSKYLKGHVKSCGCLTSKEEQSKRVAKYFPVVLKMRRAYYDMLNRCYDIKHPCYKNYGGRGVVVCEEWKNDYQKFLDWSLQNGWKPELQLDKDIIGNGLLYSPDTCKWATVEENQNSKSICVKYLYKGELLTLSQISNRCKIPRTTLFSRINKNEMSLDDAINTPLKNMGKKVRRKLSDDDVIEIRRLSKIGINAKSIWDDKYKNIVDYRSIFAVIKYETYKDVA